MRFTRSTAEHVHTSTRRGRLAAASLASAVMLVVFPADAAQAHHGFDDFDTDRLPYVAGAVSEVRWGEPHSWFTVTLDSDRPADTPDRLRLSSELGAGLPGVARVPSTSGTRASSAWVPLVPISTRCTRYA